MIQVSRAKVLDIANYINPQFHMDLSEEWNEKWPIHLADKLANCWYVKLSPSPTGTSMGTAFLLAISKESGGILYSGLVDE